MNLTGSEQTRPLLNVVEPARSRRLQALQILEAALKAVDPAAAVRNALSLDTTSNPHRLLIGDQAYDLDYFQRIFVIGAGKAGTPMLLALADLLGPRLTAGLVTVKYGYGPPAASLPPHLRIQEAGHPVLDEAGLAATAQILDLLKNLTERDLVLAVISGGGSALLEQPVSGVSLADLQALTSALLRCGATINQLNTVRKHLSQVKGGQLARLASPARVVSLILSDVVGSPLDVIGSGPTVPDTSNFAAAWQILKHFDLVSGKQLPSSILDHLQTGLTGNIPETPKPGDPLFQKVQNLIVADNRVAANAALHQARQLGFQPLLLSTFVQGEAREVALMLAALAREIRASGQPVAAPACLILGGETTVTVRGDGLGGRNQEMALAAAIEIEGLDGVMIVPLATDGSDGPNDAAGAFAEGDTAQQARQRGLDPLDFLRRNDAYHFFEQAGGLIKTGPTNTNVNDLALVLVW